MPRICTETMNIVSPTMGCARACKHMLSQDTKDTFDRVTVCGPNKIVSDRINVLFVDTYTLTLIQ